MAFNRFLMSAHLIKKICNIKQKKGEAIQIQSVYVWEYLIRTTIKCTNKLRQGKQNKVKDCKE